MTHENVVPGAAEGRLLWDAASDQDRDRQKLDLLACSGKTGYEVVGVFELVFSEE